MNKKCILLAHLLILGVVSQSLSAPILGESPQVLKQGKYLLREKLIYTASEKIWNENEERQDYEDEATFKEGFEAREFEMQIELSRGMMENLEIGARLPFLFLKKTPYLSAPKKSGHGRGDVELRAKYSFTLDTGKIPALSSLLVIKLPTGKETKKGATYLPTSSGGTNLSFMGILSKNLDHFRVYLNTAYTVTGKGKDEHGDEINPGNIFSYDLTLDYLLSQRAIFVTELRAKFASENENSRKKKIAHSKSALTTLLLGIQYETVKLPYLTLESAVDIRLTGKNEKTGLTSLLGFKHEF